MSEEKEGTDVQASAMPDTSGLALDLAMEEARSDPSLREDVAAFLRDQRSLIDIQKHHLHQQFRPQLRQLHLGVWEKRMGVFLRIATGFIGLVLAAGLAYLIWNAANSNDLVIDSFQVPPDLADRGLSGQVVAAKLSDKIAAMQTQTSSQRAPKSYANGIADGLKLQIPETGVSLSELDRFLREKLGHDLHIGGEMVRAEKGVALTVRVGNDSATVTGPDIDIDPLLQKLAEEVYRTTQPYRYSVWLQAQGRSEEGMAIFRRLADSGPSGERAWAYNGWAVITIRRESERAGLAQLRRGLALDPNHFLLTANIASSEARLGHDEEALHGLEAALARLTARGRDYAPADRIEMVTHSYRAQVLGYKGALLEAVEQSRIAEEVRIAAGIGGNPASGLSRRAEILAGLHQPSAARGILARTPLYNGTSLANLLPVGIPSLAVALEEHDWPGVVAAEKDFAALTAQFPGMAEDKPSVVDPFVARALARMGKFEAAEARIEATPADCYPCLRARAEIAELQAQRGRADWWFDRAVEAAPSIPFANTQWGQALLARGKPDEAIAQFTIANKKGPKFADPLEGWGEALMAKNQSHLAVAKFAEAEKYAPNWGRLHLKWGEALAYSGKKDEAKKQFARAAQLDLMPSEKTELAGKK